MPGSASALVSGAVLGVLASVLLPYLGIPKFEKAEPESGSPGLSCEVAAAMWRFHVTPCEMALRAPHLRQEDSVPALQLVFNTSSSGARIVNTALQGVITEDNSEADEVTEASDVYEGATLHVKGTCYIVGAAVDEATRAGVECYRQSTFAMIKPDAFARAGKVISRIEEIRTLRIAGLRVLRLEPSLVRRFYAEHSQRSFFEDLVSYITSGPVVALQLVGPDAVRVWREALGPTDSAEARRQAPTSIRALFGEDKQRNAAHGSDSAAAARRELSFFFGETSPGLLSSTEPLTPTSCLVLPHVLRDRSLGALMSSLGAHHASAASAAHLVRLSPTDALRYATGLLLPRAQPTQLQLEQMKELVAGPALSLELQSSDAEEDPAAYVRRFKDVIGPRSPAKSRKTAVESIRANYGINDAQSGVVCPWYDWPT